VTGAGNSEETAACVALGTNEDFRYDGPEPWQPISDKINAKTTNLIGACVFLLLRLTAQYTRRNWRQIPFLNTIAPFLLLVANL
jgi:hypothetical protein